MVRKLLLLGIVLLLSACALHPPLKEGAYYNPYTPPVPDGYSLIYIYRGTEPWTSEVLSRISINNTSIVMLGDSTFTQIIAAPGLYNFSASPWGFHQQFKIGANQTYYIALQLETELFSNQLALQGQFVKMDNTRYLIGAWSLIPYSTAMIELAANRYVQPEKGLFYPYLVSASK